MASEVPFQPKLFYDSTWFQQCQNSLKIDFILLLSYLITFLIQDLLRRKRLVTTSGLLSLLKKHYLNYLRWIWNAFLEKYIYICLIHSQSSMEVVITIVHARQE